MQRTSFYKRVMTLLLAFIMILGLLPISQIVTPVSAANTRAGAPEKITLGESKFNSKVYDTPSLKDVQLREMRFNVGGELSPGFCADHSKPLNTTPGKIIWSQPESIDTASGGKFAVVKPFITWYNHYWFYSQNLRQQYPNATDTELQQKAEADGMGYYGYWSDWTNRLNSCFPQGAAWLAGAGLLTNYNDPSQQRLIAEQYVYAQNSMMGDAAAPITEEAIQSALKTVQSIINEFNSRKLQ